MEFLHTIFYTIIALGVLVSFHEFGHFWVARRCGVKVIRFSIGFGKPIFSWTDKLGTEYAVAWLPLGGYVRMVDEREDDVADEDLPYAFNRKSVWKRMAIVVAGPVANFLLAIVAYWVMFVHGVSGVAAVVGEVLPGSIAERIGLKPGYEIVAVDGESISSLQQLQERLVLRIGESDTIRFTVSPEGSRQELNLSGSLGEWDVDSKNPNLLRSIGLVPDYPQLLPIVGEVLSGSSTERAGLQVGDRIISADGIPMDSWVQWVEYLQLRPDQEISLIVSRNGENVTADITPESFTEEDGTQSARVGMGVVTDQVLKWPEERRRYYSYGPVEAISKAAGKTWDTSMMTLGALKKMVTGLISPEHLSGPITIAKVAGQSAEGGVVSFLSFIALLSVSLGVLNLLPIPVLDGGHLMYYIVEAVKGSPVSERVQVIGYKVGLFLVMGLMVFALYNDLMRL
ncbi:sigma E protease regulator RseP [Porticoccaceae bacterium LTM1]|nr:sigma E protease regulator RseP [Porticoccaceae bacterium LTM1]